MNSLITTVLLCVFFAQYSYQQNLSMIELRLVQVLRYINRLDDKVTNLENSRITCDKNAANISQAVSTIHSKSSACSERIEELNKTLKNISNDLDQLDPSSSIDPIIIDTSDNAETVSMQVPVALTDCMKEFEGKPIIETNAQIICLQQMLWTFTPIDELEVSDTEKIREFVNMVDVRLPRQIARNRLRKEYRTLTLSERTRLHAAFNRLYDEGTMAVFGRVHSRAINAAHEGPAFLPWHRAFIALFEKALQSKDPFVTLPYWDSTMDSDIEEEDTFADDGTEISKTMMSIIWTDEYMGNGAGNVIEGPFVGWVGGAGNLTRAYGSASRLIRKVDIQQVLSQCRFYDISKHPNKPSSDPILEYYHDGVHVWVGADMAASTTAAYDPIFYLHHAYIDYVWETFRKRQVAECQQVNPTEDYLPRGMLAPIGHALSDSMYGLNDFTNQDGLENWWTQGEDAWYSYDNAPHCPFCGETDTLYCVVDKSVCVTQSIRANETRVPTTTSPQITSSSSSTIYVPTRQSSARPETSSSSIYAPTSQSSARPGTSSSSSPYAPTSSSSARTESSSSSSPRFSSTFLPPRRNGTFRTTTVGPLPFVTPTMPSLKPRLPVPTKILLDIQTRQSIIPLNRGPVFRGPPSN